MNTESKAKHTPGPWKYHLGRGTNPRFHIHASGGYQIASTTELERHPQAYDENELREANARLIAAAPDLLAACKTMRDDWENGNLSHAIQLIGAAIAKAEGKE